MYNSMIFPATVDEFMEEYKVVDSKHVYSNGMEMVPIFRMKQWFEHEANHNAEPGKMVDDTVSRQAAMESLMGKNVIMDGSEYHNGFNAGVNRAQEVIRNLPSVQTEIIHCKNCAFYEKEIGGNDGFALGMCRFIEQHYVTNEGFCFWAKKRGDLGGTD